MYFLFGINNKKTSLSVFDIFGRLLRVDSNLEGRERFGYGMKDDTCIGSYLEIRWNSICFELRSDYLGRDQVFYYVDDYLFLCSNSLSKLLEELRRNSINAEPNWNVIRIEQTDEWIAQQITSECTIVEGVYMLPANINITVGINDLNLSFIHHADLLYGKTYDELLIEGCNAVLNQLCAIKNKFGFYILALSGGRDSRGLLAASRYLFKDEINKFVYIQSSKHSKIDYSIVEEIAKSIGCGLNEQLPIDRLWKSLDPLLAINRWVTGNLGCYYNFNVDRSYYEDILCASVRGGQAQGSYNLKVSYTNYLSQKYGIPLAALTKHFFGACLANKMPDTTDFFDGHYLNWRYRIHYGRIQCGISSWALTFDPLMNPYFDRANFIISAEDRYRGRLSRDMILAFDSRCLDFPFDSPHKEIPLEYQKESHYFNNKIIFNFDYASQFDFNYSTPIINQNYLDEDDFLARVIDILVSEIKNSSFYIEYLNKNWKYNLARVFEDVDFDSNFIRNNLNQFSKLAQFCIALK